MIRAFDEVVNSTPESLWKWIHSAMAEYPDPLVVENGPKEMSLLFLGGRDVPPDEEGSLHLCYEVFGTLLHVWERDPKKPDKVVERQYPGGTEILTYPSNMAQDEGLTVAWFEFRELSPTRVQVICDYVDYPGLLDRLNQVRAKMVELMSDQAPPRLDATQEILQFRSLVERQLHRDIFVAGQPQESIARGLLQAFLRSRSYREVEVRGGQSDLLVFTREQRYLYETKIWRGEDYYRQGLREIEEYIIGEDDDGALPSVFYIVFDPTTTRRGGNHRECS